MGWSSLRQRFFPHCRRRLLFYFIAIKDRRRRHHNSFMFRSCFCCGPAPRRRRSLVTSPPPKDLVVKPVATTSVPAKRKYRFHNSVHRETKRNKLHRGKQISLNHTVFVVPMHVPSCAPTIIE